MEHFNLSEKKYYLFLAFIVMVFVLVIWQAFSFLPPEKTGIEAMSNYIEASSVKSDDNNEEDVKTIDNTSEDNSKAEIAVNNDSNSNLDNPPVPSEIISETSENSSPATPSESDNRAKAEKYKKAGNYTMAAEIYVNMAETASGNDEKADLYEAASVAYGMSKKYGTSLAYAQRAYNLSPTTEREILLARLYYKTGDYTKANTRMDNVMRRDFKEDR